ncbi:MAG: amidohydrolase family protein [Cyclobacteriaceae bacterium]|nr:amidohydrolase family protein [Cyclobacteriaceae bacterium]
MTWILRSIHALLFGLGLLAAPLLGQENSYLLKPTQVFDGTAVHDNWVVLTAGSTIGAVGKPEDIQIGEHVVTIDLPGLVLMPGMIEGHGHLFLYPYDQQPWNQQVLAESQSLRVARATVHAKKTLLAGVTTFRDLGTEGAGYADVGLKQAIEQDVIPGPRLLIATKAIVATGSYGPKGYATDHKMPIGAEVADGRDELIRVVREQIGNGADIIKVYADYRWGPQGEAQPTFTQEELDLIVSVANSSGRPVVAHAATEEGMLRAIMAGVQTIEHGDGGTEKVWRLMVEKEVAWCPTLAAADAILQYRGWNKGIEPEPVRISQKRKAFKQALKQGVEILAGGDVGVYNHGENVRELELMVDYGMESRDVIRAITSGNAEILGLSHLLGSIKPGLLADLIAVPVGIFQNVSLLRTVSFIMKDGKIYKHP